MTCTDPTCTAQQELDNLSYLTPTCACCEQDSQEEDVLGSLIGSAMLLGGLIGIKAVAPHAMRVGTARGTPRCGRRGERSTPGPETSRHGAASSSLGRVVAARPVLRTAHLVRRLPEHGRGRLKVLAHESLRRGRISAWVRLLEVCP